jgi:hypothetical protein
MKRDTLHWPALGRGWAVTVWAGLLLGGLTCGLRADVVEMQNGDRYVGQVLSLTAETLVIQGEVLGKLELPRGKVAVIGLGANAVTNLARIRRLTPLQSRALPAASTNSSPDFAKALRQLGLSTNLIQQVQKQLLSDAGPEAKDKFNELLGGLTTGKLNMDDLRSQARSAADQIRSLKKDLGEDAGWTMDAYMGILDHFLKETARSGGAATNAPAVKPPKAESAEAE